MELPERFLSNMKALLDNEYDEYIESFQQKRTFGLRVNTSKISVEEFLNIVPFTLEPIPWIHNGFYVKREDAPAKHPYYYAGLYYLQEPSAMTPASLLPIEPGERVLDICAAPGGKATELGSRLLGEGVLVANDISHSRAKGLLKNLELFGLQNINVISENPGKLVTYLKGYFHKILVDAPCSGEGMFRKDDNLIKSWLDKGPDFYCKIQKEILTQSVDMLREDGLLLYSTCTFSPLENEAVVMSVLKEYPEMELQPVPLQKGFSCGRPDCIENGDDALTGCIRLYPHRIHGEGHFMALLHKKKLMQTKAVKQEELGFVYENVSRECQNQEAISFLKEVNFSRHNVRYSQIGDCIYLTTPELPPLSGIRYLRTGLLLGTIIKGRFEPSQALAMSLKCEQYPRCISFSEKDIRTIKYLKGETVDISDMELKPKGYVLVCVEHFPLGFAKSNGVTLKNKYPAGWRWQ